MTNTPPHRSSRLKILTGERLGYLTYAPRLVCNTAAAVVVKEEEVPMEGVTSSLIIMTAVWSCSMHLITLLFWMIIIIQDHALAPAIELIAIVYILVIH